MMKYQDYQIVPAKLNPNSYEILFDGRGKVAAVLQGLYTSPTQAMGAIDRYLKLGSHAKTAVESGS